MDGLKHYQKGCIVEGNAVRRPRLCNVVLAICHQTNALTQVYITKEGQTFGASSSVCTPALS